MPPFLPRKRPRSPTPEAGPSEPPANDKAKKPTPRKPTLFDDLDAGSHTKRSAEHQKALLEQLAATDDDDSSLSSLSEPEFEDVRDAKRQKVDDEDDEEEGVEFEDVETHSAAPSSALIRSGDLELTLTKDPRISITNPFGTKKGPSKIERQIRISTHKFHVQILMFHNAIRNAWLCDKELQEILVQQLPPTIKQQIEKWRVDSGLASEESPKEKGKGKGKGKAKSNQRDWGDRSERVADGGDHLPKLLLILTRYWKQRFRITAPGLRKLGYMSLQTLDEEMKSFREDEYDPERHGERFINLEDFRNRSKLMEGSRDFGAQLFTALMRGIDLDARMVASVQPVGFGWSQYEEAFEKNPRKLRKPKPVDEVSSEDDEAASSEEKPTSKPTRKNNGNVMKKLGQASTKSTKRISGGNGRKDAPIDLSESEATDESDEESVIDITPARKRTQPSMPYDKDLVFPHYWTEVLSPVTKNYIPVDPIVLPVVAADSKLFGKFETRGAKSEKSKQVTAYIVGHSSDGSAKEVTTRYLKSHVWPGRTRGNRVPIEKIPIHNRLGKVVQYEEYDWFKRVMNGYTRGTKACPWTEIDEHEDATVLKKVRSEKKKVEEGKESLQYYKSSSEFVLERHLKRDEALRPDAKHVKIFTIKSKGEDAVEKVFLRKDVVENCKSVETWHKEGRAPIPGEEPLKRVPYRISTINRKRELAEAEQASGEKILQGLYSRDQTDWIIPPPIENGIIPKNNFGNIDLYVDTMLPSGAVHIPMRGTVKICKRLGIDYAEAVTGFEFGHRMAVPIISGVVIAQEHYQNLMDEWQKDELKRTLAEDQKRRNAAIGMWRKMLMGMRISARVREEYGGINEDDVDMLNPFTRQTGKATDENLVKNRKLMDQRDEDMAGGFLPEGFNVAEPEDEHHHSFFPVAHDEEDDQAGGFVVEGHEERIESTAARQAYATPQSLLSAMKSVPDREDSENPESELEAARPKRRGRPVRSSPTTAKAKTPTSANLKGKQAVLPQHIPASRNARKRHTEVQESENENDDLSSESVSDVEAEKDTLPESKSSPKRGRAAKSTQSSRTTPKRKAARKSETALKSHYFNS